MSWLESVCIAFSMFSRFPMPRLDWTPRRMRGVMACFPLVGLVVGGGVFLWGLASQLLGLGELLRGVGFALVPLGLTGGIHLDGLADTADALASQGSPQRKQEILRDPHIGAFAVMAVSTYLMAFAALGSQLELRRGTLGALAGVFILSRCLSALGMVLFPLARGGGLAHAFAVPAARRVTAGVGLVGGILTAAAIIWLGGIPGAAAVLASLATFAVYRFWLLGQFGGLSGDLAGWFVEVAELAALGGLVLVQRVLSIL